MLVPANVLLGMKSIEIALHTKTGLEMWSNHACAIVRITPAPDETISFALRAIDKKSFDSEN